ncbi:hypothetical protein QUF80_20895 [Desulfococcaceae bacterium HSG8]|nr:hypothetical protein [Desulfococcaceae bacterium HSG8]
MAQENDIVLIYFEDKPLTFARIEDISPDIKPDWYHVRLLILQVPLQVVTWILKDVYIEGEEFTMDAKRMRLELVVCPEEPRMVADEDKEDEIPEDFGDGKVISFASRKRNK